MIGQHPALYGLPEVNLFAAEHYAGLSEGVYRLRPGFRHGLLRAVAELGLDGQSVEHVETARGWLAEHENVSGSEIFRDLAAWAAPRRLVDKSPIYVYGSEALPRIRRAFPDASYLHLTRHPRSTCESVYKLRERVQEKLRQVRGGAAAQLPRPQQRLADVEDPDSLWLRPHRRILDFLAGVPQGRQLRVRGEAFMAGPEEHLRQICEWLHVSADVDAIEAMKHPERSPFACMGPPNARFGNDPSFLESPALRPYEPKPSRLDGVLEGSDGATLSAELRDLASELGYS